VKRERDSLKLSIGMCFFFNIFNTITNQSETTLRQKKKESIIYIEEGKGRRSISLKGSLRGYD
jgi:hypothetical protein